MDVVDRARLVGAEAVEKGSDLVAEARYEREQERAGSASRRTRRPAARQEGQ
jgi:hypothetical protein